MRNETSTNDPEHDGGTRRISRVNKLETFSTAQYDVADGRSENVHDVKSLDGNQGYFLESSCHAAIAFFSSFWSLYISVSSSGSGLN